MKFRVKNFLNKKVGTIKAFEIEKTNESLNPFYSLKQALPGKRVRVCIIDEGMKIIRVKDVLKPESTNDEICRIISNMDVITVISPETLLEFV